MQTIGLDVENIIEVNLDNFQQVLLEGSKQKLVVIDFWADWCEPCKQLMPVLEKLAAEFSEQIVLAKINCDQQQELAMQFGVRSLPTVAIMKDGQPIDGFAGVQPEGQIRELIEKHLPSPQQDWFEQALVFIEQDNWQQAYPLLQQCVDAEPQNPLFLITLANASIELGKLEQAESLLAKITMVDQDASYQQVLSKLALAKQASESPEVVALQQLLQKEPDSLDVKLKLAIAMSQANRNEEALALVYEVLNVDLAFADAKKVYLDMIANLPDGDELAGQYRRKLYTLLY